MKSTTTTTVTTVTTVTTTSNCQSVFSLKGNCVVRTLPNQDQKIFDFGEEVKKVFKAVVRDAENDGCNLGSDHDTMVKIMYRLGINCPDATWENSTLSYSRSYQFEEFITFIGKIVTHSNVVGYYLKLKGYMPVTHFKQIMKCKEGEKMLSYWNKHYQYYGILVQEQLPPEIIKAIFDFTMNWLAKEAGKERKRIRELKKK